MRWPLLSFTHQYVVGIICVLTLKYSLAFFVNSE